MSTNSRIRQEREVVLKAWLIAGTIDICLAFLYSYIKNDVTPDKVLSYISKIAFKGNITSTALPVITGLLVHYIIALVWTMIYYKAAPKAYLLRSNFWLGAVIYGLFVWGMMNLVIVPIWTGKPVKLDPVNSPANAVILIIAIGIPLSYFIGGLFRKKEV
jgi:uncharacterized membrane protein YagU involved in acid resistance